MQYCLKKYRGGATEVKVLTNSFDSVVDHIVDHLQGYNTHVTAWPIGTNFGSFSASHERLASIPLYDQHSEVSIALNRALLKCV